MSKLTNQSLSLNQLFPVGGMGRLIASVALCAGLNLSLAQAQEVNEQGWTVLEPSGDTRFIFVSSSSGSDSNSGLSPDSPLKTLARAKSFMRAGSADWMLLKRGDVWNEGLGWWAISGRSAEERLVITSYGDLEARPKLVISEGRGMGGKYNRVSGNIAIVGLHFEADRSVNHNVSGISWLSSGENLLIEDCRIEGFKDNVTCQASNGQYENFAIRRSVIENSWSSSSHSQGVYISNTLGVVLEENVFDGNGWNPDIDGANPTIYNQNVYIQTGTLGTEFHGNITSRASGAGVQMRSGGHASHNLVYANPLGIRLGYSTLAWPEDAASGSLTKNVVLGGELSDAGLLGSGSGIWFERVSGVEVSENVVAQYLEGSINWAYSFHGHAADVKFHDNVGANWGMAVRVQAQVDDGVLFESNQFNMPGTSRIMEIWHMDGIEFLGNSLFGFDIEDDAFYVEGDRLNFDEWAGWENVDGDSVGGGAFASSGRDLDQYAQTLGFADAAAFIDAAKGQSRTNWDPRLTGRAAADWIRVGYISGD